LFRADATEAPNFMLFIVAGLVVISAILSPGLFFAWRLKNFGNDGLGLKEVIFAQSNIGSILLVYSHYVYFVVSPSALFLPADITHARPCVSTLHTELIGLTTFWMDVRQSTQILLVCVFQSEYRHSLLFMVLASINIVCK